MRPFTSNDENLRSNDLSDGEDGEEDPLKILKNLAKGNEKVRAVIKSITAKQKAIRDGIETDDVEQDLTEDLTVPPPPPPIENPIELIGRTFLMDPDKDGNVFRARIKELVDDHISSVEENPHRKQFLCSINNDKAEEIISYRKMLDYLSREENPTVWKFKRIVAHQGPLRRNHPQYINGPWNVQVEWENGEITTEPMVTIAADDPITVAIYAKENKLLDTPRWKRFKRDALRHKKFIRMVNAAKLRSYNTAPKYKYGFEVPRDYKHAMRLDERNGNTKWKDAVKTEMDQIAEYDTFEKRGLYSKEKEPAGYKKIRVHLVFDVKHDGRHKARLVADGHLTDVPVESVYSGVVSLRGFRLVMFTAELNGIEPWSTDVGNAYLESFTREKVFIVAGPEFGPELEGHVLIVRKALYGLRTSGKMWHERFAACLREMGFWQSKAEPEIWMRRNGEVYEYVATYVDDLCMALLRPQEFIDELEKKYKFKLKGTGKITFHLGMDFYREPNGDLCMAPRKYIEKMISNYERVFGETPKQTVMAPLEKGDHPELDTSELLDQEGINQYQSLIGQLQWAISIGRFDIHTAVMTMSGFRAAPRRGHLERCKRIVGYLSKMRHAAIRIRTEEPDQSDLPSQDLNWDMSIYGDNKEEIPEDAPEPLGKFVTLTHYVDANLMHDTITGKSVTGILHVINQTPIDWYSKKQATVETATYGSEFVAARTAVEQIMDLRLTLRYLGIPLREKSYMYGDNKAVIDSSTHIEARLHKRHSILSFHRVRSAIASGMLEFHHIPGTANPADILSKHWGYQAVWPQLRPLLFWAGDTLGCDTPAAAKA